ncbi:hypothetical protein CROQUDRAFT_662055 [Cronartium quercuum f. sp. fusiforme G11]|uniref:Uncharacterized protein n=1 Tax=Cronartium quercuum f. sp. fusiforme G11 TaxID=708437 RepID=A0A9P6NEK8_9BASI|nr:hypothetical protein CROQUDRAFT_662055 [Cronartium quercuum f. sp. fusiforme G11]
MSSEPQSGFQVPHPTHEARRHTYSSNREDVLPDPRAILPNVTENSGASGSCNSGEEPNLPLPFSTWLAHKMTNAEQLSSDRSIIHKPTRSLSWLIIRELALWEDVFIRSRLYRILKKLTPSILPTSSVYPFVIGLLLAALQIRKLWIWQRQSLIQIIITAGPILNTIDLLSRLQHTTHLSAIERGEIIRWLSYWLIYGSVCNLENIKVRSGPSSISQTYPHLVIYPRSASRNNNSFNTALRTWQISKQWLRNVIPQSIYSKSTHKRPFPEPRPHRHQSPSNSNAQYYAAPFLHEKIFGEHRLLYTILKVLFLRWCSSNTSRGSEQIWSHFLSPFLSLITSYPSSKPKSNRGVHILVVAGPVYPGSVSSSPPRRSAANLTQDQNEGSRIGDQQQSIRRVQSDPVPSIPGSDPDSHSKVEEPTDSCRTNLTKRSLCTHELRTPENAWDTLSYVA